MSYRAPELVRLSLSNGNTLEGTPWHPLFVDGVGWSPIGDLQPGARLRTASGVVEVTATEEDRPSQGVFNFEVSQENAYFVAEGRIWAHNSTPCAGGTPKGGVYTLRDPVSGEVMRSGRSNNLARRMKEHARDKLLGQYEFQVEFRTDDYAEIRGLEQMLHEVYNPPLNGLRGIDPRRQEKWKFYEEAARKYLEKLE